MNNYDYDTWNSDVNDFFILSRCLSFEKKGRSKLKRKERKEKRNNSEIRKKCETTSKHRIKSETSLKP